MHELHFHPDDYTELEVETPLNTRVRNNTPPLVVTNPARSVIKFKQQNVLVTFRKTWLETRRVHWESETFPELGCLTGFMPVESEYTSGEASSPSCCSKVSCSLLCLQRVPSVSNKFYICDASWIQRMRSCVCVCVCVCVARRFSCASSRTNRDPWTQPSCWMWQFILHLMLLMSGWLEQFPWRRLA